nr:glucoamylase family protein [uncultured Acetatifactor sp.]
MRVWYSRGGFLKRRIVCLLLAGTLLLAGCGAEPPGDAAQEQGASAVQDGEESKNQEASVAQNGEISEGDGDAIAQDGEPTGGEAPILPDQEVLEEAKGCFLYLWEQVQTDEASGAYGMVRDRYPGAKNVSSIAATGFALAAIPYGIEKGWITKEQGEERADKTMDTLLSLEQKEGFLYHFINMLNGEPGTGSEVSVIDTGILLCGAVTAGEYFGESVQEKAKELYERVDWNYFLDGSRNMFYMSCSPEGEFSGHWDVYAEQLMLYVLAAGSPTHPLDKGPYEAFGRLKGRYGEYEFIHSWFGSIFTYQFSHAFLDFRGLVDEQGTDWYQNSVTATLAARQFCIEEQDTWETYGENAWGLTACDTPEGYNGLLGAPPSGTDNRAHESSGTIAPAGAIGSMPFTPEESTAALKHYRTFPELVGEYGLKDAYNLDRNWFGQDYIGIDKGISLLMIANYEGEFVWKYFMENEAVRSGLERLGFSAKE